MLHCWEGTGAKHAILKRHHQERHQEHHHRLPNPHPHHPISSCSTYISIFVPSLPTGFASFNSFYFCNPRRHCFFDPSVKTLEMISDQGAAMWAGAPWDIGCQKKDCDSLSMLSGALWTGVAGFFPLPFLPMHPGCLWVALLPIGASISLRKLSRPKTGRVQIRLMLSDVVRQGRSKL